MVTYVINRTDKNNPSTNVDEKTINQQLPIALFGREKLEYGELMNENILHLLENFACPEDPENPGNPLLSPDEAGQEVSGALRHTLENAIEGQLWYNSTSTVQLLYVYKIVDDVGSWVPLSMFSEIAANSGTIAHGEQIPLPVSSTGATFTYDECSWMVGPYHYDDEVEYMICSTEEDATVRMQYRVTGGGGLVNGIANYMIIGIRGNVNRGINNIEPPAITPTQTPAPTMTPTPTFGVTATVTPTVTVTPPASAIPPTPSHTPPETPPNSVEPFGDNARLFVNPSPGYTASVDSGRRSYQSDSCGDLVWDEQDPATVAAFRHLYFSSALDKSNGVSIVGLDGGVPPYTVDFSNVYFTGSNNTTTYMMWPTDPNPYPLPREPVINNSYFGGNRQDSSHYEIRINVDPNEEVRAVGQTDTGNDDVWYDLDTASYLGWWMDTWGYVIATDSVGTSITLWITEDATQASGSNQRVNPGGTYKFNTTWDHYYDCSLCPGNCDEEVRIIGYP